MTEREKQELTTEQLIEIAQMGGAATLFIGKEAGAWCERHGFEPDSPYFRAAVGTATETLLFLTMTGMAQGDEKYAKGVLREMMKSTRETLTNYYRDQRRELQ